MTHRLINLFVAISLLFAPGALPAAAGEKPGDKELWTEVAVVMNPALVEGCEFVCLVSAKTDATLFSGYKKKKRAHRKLRKRALAAGGDTVLLFQNRNGRWKTKLSGEAYRCKPTAVDGDPEPVGGGS